jgi:hypothetical protein
MQHLSTRGRRARLLPAWLLAGILAAQPAFAADLSVPLPPEKDAPREAIQPASPHIFNYGNDHPSCQSWTDDCRTCTAAGCSNVGIACQPGPIRCSKETSPDRK